MIITSDASSYILGPLVRETANFRLYLCEQEESERQCLLQIADSVDKNGLLDRAAYVLEELKRKAEELEEEYEAVKTDPKVLLNYHLGFPALADSFVCNKQGGRRINILVFRCVDDIGNMVPLRNITDKDKLRVDLRTSAWIMGKSLKTLAFAHNEGLSVGNMSGNNIVIKRDQHYAVIFDWSAAQTFADGIPLEIRRREIAQLAQSIIRVLGGSLVKDIPNDGDPAYARYNGYLRQLADGRVSDANRAHEDFYAIVDESWPREFYPCTTLPLDD